MKRNFSKPGPMRLVQIKRLFTLAAMFACARGEPMSVATIAEKFSDRTSESWCHRTIRRDVNGLCELGLVQATTVDKNGVSYVWVGDHEFSHVASQSAPPPTVQRELSSAMDAAMQSLLNPWVIDDDHRAEIREVKRRLAEIEAKIDQGLDALFHDDESRAAKFRQSRTTELDRLRDQQIIDLFNRRSYLTYDVVQRDLGCSRNAAAVALKSLECSGLLECTGTSPRRYTLDGDDRKGMDSADDILACFHEHSADVSRSRRLVMAG